MNSSLSNELEALRQRDASSVSCPLPPTEGHAQSSGCHQSAILHGRRSTD